MSVTVEQPKGLALALGMSPPPSGKVEKVVDVDRLEWEKERLERSIEDYSPHVSEKRPDFERRVLGRDDYERLVSVRQQLEEAKRPQPVREDAPVETAPKKNDKEKRTAWRKANSEFHPFKLLGERLKEKESAPGKGAEIMAKFDLAMTKADEFDYDAGIALLGEAIVLAKAAQVEIEREKVLAQQFATEKEEEHKALFDFVVIVEDKEYGFDTDTDAENFYLANTIAEGSSGTLVKSDKLKKMEKAITECAERKRALQAKGATIDEIVSTVYKNIPEALWPDDVVKEVALYKSVTAQIEAEKGIEEAENALKSLSETTETVETVVGIAESGIDFLKEKFGEHNEKFKQAMEVMGTFAKGISLTNSMLGAGAEGLSSGESAMELEELKDNPVKEKILEFERNKAIVTCVNGLVGAGLGFASDWVPVLGAVVSGKDMLLEVAKAGYYFKNTLNLKVLEKGAKTDPRSAALLPLARLAREQKIALAESALKAVSSALETAGKATELSVVASPIGAGLSTAGTVISIGTTAFITGINWSDAAKAAKLIADAAGPPPLRRAQVEVMKFSSKYAKVAICHLAMKERDAWAIGHLENMGLGRTDIDHPQTSSKLLREYMALKGGGILGDEQGEDQETFGESIIGKAGKKIAEGAEWVRDKIVGRDKSIVYNPAWRADLVDLSIAGWKEVHKQAIAAGWYDSRPNLEGALATYEQARQAYSDANPDDNEACIAASTALVTALETLQSEINDIEPVANDRTTEHSGMKAFLFEWWRLAGERRDSAAETRSRYIDYKAFPGLEGEALELAKKDVLEKAVEAAVIDQKRKRDARTAEITRLWDAYEITTPYVKCKLLEFPSKIEAGMFRDYNLNFGEPEKRQLEPEVNQLREMVISRLVSELIASPDDQLRRNFVASAMTAEKIVAEALRAACQRLFEAKNPPTRMWTPKPADIVLDGRVWQRVMSEAETREGGWAKPGATGFTKLLEAYQTGVRDFEIEQNRKPVNPTALEQKRGLLLGAIDAVEKAFKGFRPVTAQKFFHPGLITYRDGIVELCVAARIKYSTSLLG
ncbi:hypothetical protein Psta_1235 [Pirellula staleyi DSM 6068]|uniref:Uncharacterized protein n=1 Tax=Pirellula staleyi (strain ATCC 27377 / DSM 6068 / ICPB 4128) TaxID=530564 RepID=D2QW38_PIRSD|nr:hypothetical protein [Pirellula staleyi]ADB15913.1 hypothetical protein Psta_1235 [Pirellula staleyi DSM 6068]